MRGPSARVLENQIDIYAETIGRDVDGGVVYSYPSAPTYGGVAASVQPKATEIVDEQDRVTRIVTYLIIIGQPLILSSRSKILWTDSAGVLHTIIYEADRDNAGRGAAFTYYGVERL